MKEKTGPRTLCKVASFDIPAVKLISFGAFLYPLERIHSNMQLQSTYNKQSLKNHKEIPTLSTRYGLFQSFRGFKPYTIRISSIALTTRILNHQFVENRQTDWLIKAGLVGFIQGLLYPFDNIRVRMGADIERIRIYEGLSDCYRKMRKFEGIKSFYRGFMLNYLYVAGQGALASSIFCYLGRVERQSIGETIGKLGLSILLSELLIYPLDTLRKIYQINGAMGHTHNFSNVRYILSLNPILSYYSGFSFRLLNLLLYTSAYLFWVQS